MHRRRVRHAAALALAASLGSASLVSADALLGDGDLLTPNRQNLVDLGPVAPGAVITVDVGFELVCSGTSHPDAGQSVTLTPIAGSVPGDGAVVAVDGTSLGPVPTDWPADGAACPTPAPVVTGSSVSATLRAPTVPNTGYVFTLAWRRTLAPEGANDAAALTGSATGVSFRLDVVDDVPPSLVLPADRVVEADTTGGWTSAYAVTATDLEDDPDPTPTCDPASDALLPLGTTTVECTVTDSSGQTDTGTFDVTVVDTTAPVLATLPVLQVESADPTGADVSWANPTASDVADSAPHVSCAPAPGAWFPIGPTAVTCDAIDASGNRASTTFEVEVVHVPTSTAGAAWLDPLAVTDGGTFTTNRGRTIPVKVAITVDDEVRTTGHATLALAPCGGGPVLDLPLAVNGGRWTGALDTGALSGSCHVVSVSIDGLHAGAFRLELRGGEAARSTPRGW